MKSFSDWVEKGYKKLAIKRNTSYELLSWRFWTKEFHKDVIVCGLIRDSSDSIGRPYPLLIMGEGPLKDWQDHLDLLPFACEKPWSQLEYISSQMFKDLKKLTAEIYNIQPPYPEWSEFNIKKEN